MDCVFCKIVKKDIPASIVYEDKDTLAFLDIHPITPGHTLVIPTQHFMNIEETPETVLVKLMNTTKKIATALGKMAEGVNIGQNNGKAAGQLVMHVHFHVIPRSSNDGLKHWSGKKYAEGEIEKIATQIKTFL